MSTPDHRLVPTWILRSLVMLGIALCVPGVLVGVVIVVLDLQDTSDQWHGLGAFLGGLLAGAALIGIVVLGVLLLMLFKWVRAGLVATGGVAGLALAGFVVLLVNDPGQLADFAAFSAAPAVILGLVAWALAPAAATDSGRTAPRP